jgi:2-polyprenyl-3-methyl-5-hydroxy-6-metoxy-1,4-benzoquinol methylase
MEKSRKEKRNVKKKVGQAVYWDGRVNQFGDTVHACEYTNYRSYITGRRAILQWVSLTPGMKVLDVGCGTGVFSRPFLIDDTVIVGVDIAFHMLELAVSRLTSVIQADAIELPIRSESFDMVLCNQIAQCLPSLEPLVSALCLSVKRGGVVVISTLNPTFFVRMLLQWKVKKQWYLHGERTLREVMYKQGLRNLQTLWVPYPAGKAFTTQAKPSRRWGKLIANYYAIMGVKPG